MLICRKPVKDALFFLLFFFSLPFLLLFLLAFKFLVPLTKTTILTGKGLSKGAVTVWHSMFLLTGGR